jgi:inorganic triphosphatase YgiF
MADRRHEIELKFSLSPETGKALSAGLFEGVDGDELVSTYFDTPERALLKAGAALRLRKTGNGWVQTLKAGPNAVRRFEEERPLASAQLDPRLMSKRKFALATGGRRNDLRPVFETHVHRRARCLEREGALIEAALDEGEIIAGDRREAVREFELELKAGRLSDLLEAARPYVEAGGATLSLISKAERGYRLASGEGPAAGKFARPPLDFEGPAREGFQALAMATLHQLSGAIEHLRERASRESVHQARVALRRLKTFVGAFKGLVRDERRSTVKAAMDRLIGIFEDARTLDVLQASVLEPLAGPEPGAAEFGEALAAARASAYADLKDALNGQAAAGDLFELVAWVLDGPWTRASQPTEGDPALADLAQRALAHRWKILKRRGRRLDWTDPHARHRLRIQAKAMRYLSEAMLDPVAAKPFINRLEALQNELGDLNDIASASEAARLVLTPAVTAEAAFAGGSMVAARRSALPDHLAAARKAFRRLERRSVDWTQLRTSRSG